MTINLDQNDELEKQQLSQGTDDQIKFSGESRRRFATSGLAVSGIILTLSSRPVLGDTFCMSPSGFISGNTSQHGACPPVSTVTTKLVTNPDETFLAAFPKSSQSNTSYNDKRLSDMLTIPWPEPKPATVTAPVQVEKNKLGAASYMTTFSGSSGSSSLGQKGKGSKNTTVPTSTTSTSVIAPPNPPFQTQELLQHLVKALQNARSGATPYLTVGTIQSMFYEWQDHGTFSPTANVNWNASEIIYYLKLTQSN
ncbi:MAG: hypothetical protein DID92_2727744880 [Candidatus Nitrotoga sp. SPKER]|nr:MAG: hypothetical protein DID92_2727744880 [Candidatus Nitrotoga sp. SPKER]